VRVRGHDRTDAGGTLCESQSWNQEWFACEDAAVQMEKDLAEDLRRAGYTVTGGH